MSLLDWFRRTFVPLRRTDPRFGPLYFQRMSGRHGSSYWEGSGTFASEQVEFFVDAGEEGPTAEQRALVDELEGRWAALERRLAPFLAQHVREAREARVSEDLADWSLSSLSIPAPKDRAGSVEIGFVHRADGELLTFELDPRREAPRELRFGS